MGDMADYLTDRGIDELATHNAGECEGPCSYCDAEEKLARKQKRKQPIAHVTPPRPK